MDPPDRDAAPLRFGEPGLEEAFEQVTVLFADISRFTVMSSKISAAELVAFLNQVFPAFDAISHRHGREKIKTIGDAYMAAAGIPEPRADHADAVMRAAIEMRDVVARTSAPGGAQLAMRIGIHSGPGAGTWRAGRGHVSAPRQRAFGRRSGLRRRAGTRPPPARTPEPEEASREEASPKGGSGTYRPWAELLKRTLS